VVGSEHMHVACPYRSFHGVWLSRERWSESGRRWRAEELWTGRSNNVKALRLRRCGCAAVVVLAVGVGGHRGSLVVARVEAVPVCGAWGVVVGR
jgi:hypothetical protein